MAIDRKCTEEIFLRDVAHHDLTIIRDDGVNRHIRFKSPDTSYMSFDLITWPGHLCYTGDMGTFVFQRTEDMFRFFRTKPEEHKGLYINTGYWGEKVIAIDATDGIREYSPENFNEAVNQWTDDIIDSYNDDGREDTDEFSEQLKNEILDQILIYAEDGEVAARTAVDDFGMSWEGTEYVFRDVWEVTLTQKTDRFVWCCYALAWGINKYDQAKASTT